MPTRIIQRPYVLSKTNKCLSWLSPSAHFCRHVPMLRALSVPFHHPLPRTRCCSFTVVISPILSSVVGRGLRGLSPEARLSGPAFRPKAPVKTEEGSETAQKRNESLLLLLLHMQPLSDAVGPAACRRATILCTPPAPECTCQKQGITNPARLSSVSISFSNQFNTE